ncbi:MAG: glycosyltransferase family 4 protein [Candidatus Omnitrophota bacterium]
MPKINLLYVITKLELGGAQKQLLSLIAGLDKSRYAVVLFSAHQGLLFKEAASIPGVSIHASRFLERPVNPLKDLIAFFEIYWFIRKNKFHVVHTHSSKAGILGRLAARLAKAPSIIHTVHGWSFNEYQPAFVRFVYIWLERVCARFSDAVIVVSLFDKQKGCMLKIGGGSLYRLIRYGIDYHEFRPQQEDVRSKARERLGIRDNELLVGMAACFKPQKNPLDFIRIASLISEYCVSEKLPCRVRFLLVGDGVLRGRIEKKIGESGLGSQVILAGWRFDMPELYAAMDVLVLTSLWEGLPVVVLEAMRLEVPVVVTNTGGVAEVVKNGVTGFLVAAREPALMARQVSALLKNDALRKRLGQASREALGDSFSAGKMVLETAGMYESILKTKGIRE